MEKEYLSSKSTDAAARYATTIIIPACDEEDRIGPTLDSYLAHFDDDTEILVVMNGCRDGTRDVVCSFLDGRPNLHAVEETDSIGKGGALMIGFRRARGDVISYVDADGATSPEDMQRLLEAMGDDSGVIASRWIDPSVMRVKQSLYRRFASRVFNSIIRVMFRIPYRDTQCGAKAFKREAVEAIVDKLGTTNCAFDVDVLYLMHQQGYTVKEMPLAWVDMPGTKIKMYRDAPRMLGAVIRMRTKHSRFKNLVR